MYSKKRFFSIINRNKNLISNIVATGGIKGVAVLINLFTTPAYLSYFSSDAILGVWLTIISILSTISVLDFGLSDGLRNKLTVALSLEQGNEVRKLISSAYFVIIIICSSVFFLGYSLIPMFDWSIILGIDKSELNEQVLHLCIKIVFLTIALQMIFRIISSVLYAQQKAALVSLLSVITNAFMLFFVLFFKGGNSEKNLVNLSLAYLFSSTFPYLVVSFVVFAIRKPEISPKIKYVEVRKGFNILSLGIKFFYLSLMSMMVHNTNELLISILFDASRVVEYQIYNKIFFLIVTFINILMIPLWSAVTSAFSRKQYMWIRKAHNILCFTSVIAFAFGLILLPFMQGIVDFWLGKNSIAIRSLYCLPFSVYVAIEVWNGANATIANGAGLIKAQMVMGPITFCLNIFITIILKEVLNSWISIQIANIISLIPVAVVQFVYIRKKLMKQCDL